ncbi:MAG: c-type cytochrome [Beijerinckiaceae bacterium]|jgi:cytochrome c
MMKGFNAAIIATGFLITASGMAFAQEATDPDPVKGKQTFNQCLACHRIGPDAKALVGPPLTNVIGRKAGSFEGFAYSPLLKAAGDAGLVWSQAAIVDYLVNPSNYLKKYLTDNGKPDAATGASKMVYMLANEGQRKNVVAYVATFSTAK